MKDFTPLTEEEQAAALRHLTEMFMTLTKYKDLLPPKYNLNIGAPAQFKIDFGRRVLEAYMNRLKAIGEDNASGIRKEGQAEGP